MGLKTIIRNLIREEISQVVEPAPSVPSMSSARDLARRPDTFSRLALLLEEQRTILAKDAEISGIVVQTMNMEAELRELRSTIHAHRAQQWCAQQDISLAIDRQFCVLRDTASPLLHQFIEEMNLEHARLCRLVPINETGFGSKNLLSEIPKTPRHTYSNAPAIARRCLAVIAARNRAEELKLLDKTEEELCAELESLRAALPPIETCELVRV